MMMFISSPTSGVGNSHYLYTNYTIRKNTNHLNEIIQVVSVRCAAANFAF